MKEAQEYLTAKNLDTTYWGKKIIAAEARGNFTESNINQSAEWVTCACGRLTGDIPRAADTRFQSYNMPLDRVLKDLGFEFYNAVEDNEFLYAAELLDKIETRARIVAKQNTL